MLRQFFSPKASTSSAAATSTSSSTSVTSTTTSMSGAHNSNNNNNFPSNHLQPLQQNPMDVSSRSEANVPGSLAGPAAASAAAAADPSKPRGVQIRNPPPAHQQVTAPVVSKPNSHPGDSADIDPSNNDSLVSLFECPVCFEYVLPPIIQCLNGHLICKNCRGMIHACPTCRVLLGPNNIRNLSLEKLSMTVRFPCKYSSNGCQELFYQKEKVEHEETKCPFKPYTCPCPGSSCKWTGSMDQVMEHLMVSHKSITTLEGEDIVFLATDINLSGAVDWVMIQSCYGHHFMLVLEKAEKYPGHQQFFAAVVLIGGDRPADHFTYRLELNANRRRALWEAVPRSIHEGVQSAINTSDCMVFDACIAHHFSDGGNLGINVTIQLTPPGKDGLHHPNPGPAYLANQQALHYQQQQAALALQQQQAAAAAQLAHQQQQAQQLQYQQGQQQPGAPQPQPPPQYQQGQQQQQPLPQPPNAHQSSYPQPDVARRE